MVVSDVQSALDLLMTAKYEAGTGSILIGKDNIAKASSCSARASQGKSCRSA